MILRRHLVEAVEPRHREGQHARAVGKLAEVHAPDQQTLVDDLANIVEALPRRIQVAQQNVAAGLQRALGVVADLDLFQAVARVYADVGIAGDAAVLAVLHVELFAEPGEDGRRHGVQHVALGEEALPVPVSYTHLTLPTIYSV